jgi:hypothetical protein
VTLRIKAEHTWTYLHAQNPQINNHRQRTNGLDKTADIMQTIQRCQPRFWVCDVSAAGRGKRKKEQIAAAKHMQRAVFLLCTRIAVAKNSSRYMLPHPHPDAFNIEACWACGGNRLCHTITGVEKRCNPNEQSFSFVFLWCPVKRHTHIKRQKRFNPLLGEGRRQSSKKVSST